MSRGIFVKSGPSSWSEIKHPYVNVNGTWTPVRQGLVKVNGIWQRFYPNSGTAIYRAAGDYRFSVSPGIYQLTINAAGGGGGGGTLMDGGYNDDNGSSGGGSSGQMVTNFSIPVRPDEVITIHVGGGGAPGPFVRDGNDTGSPGDTTSVSCSSGTYYLLGGNGGAGGSPQGGINFPGGQYPRSNSSIPNFFGYDGTSRYSYLAYWQITYSYGEPYSWANRFFGIGGGTNQRTLTGPSAGNVQAQYDALPATVNGYDEDGNIVTIPKQINSGPSAVYPTVGGAGGAGYLGASQIAAGTNNSNGNSGTQGGGGSGVYSGWLREDHGVPGFYGGTGGSGFVDIMWGPGVDPNYPS